MHSDGVLDTYRHYCVIGTKIYRQPCTALYSAEKPYILNQRLICENLIFLLIIVYRTFIEELYMLQEKPYILQEKPYILNIRLFYKSFILFFMIL